LCNSSSTHIGNGAIKSNYAANQFTVAINGPLIAICVEDVWDCRESLELLTIMASKMLLIGATAWSL
jgi:hypothetical protein